MLKDVPPSLFRVSESRLPSVSVTVAVEYKEATVHHSRTLPDKIIHDFAYLQLPQPAPADIHESIGDWVEVHLICIPFELKRLRDFELSQDRVMVDLKHYCGIKRMWRLTRSPFRPTAGPSLKRPIANCETEMEDVEKKRKKPEPDPHLRITTPPSELDPPPSPSITSSQDTTPSLMKLQEGTCATESPPHKHTEPPERSPGHLESTPYSRKQETTDIVLLRMLPLDQSELPKCADVGDDPVEESSAQTRDPRRSGSNPYASPSESTGSQEQDGYPTGTQLLLVDTFEKRPRGWETKLRRLFQHDRRRQAELRVHIEPEREGGRRRIEMLERELQELRKLVREIRTELETRKLRNRDLERKIEDMRRECEHPFVVPSLIDAFLKMGDLSGAIMQD